MTAPRWPRLLVVRLLLPLGILGALALSAAATVALVERHGVPGGVRPFAVAMLEVIQVAATLLTIFGTTPRLRGRAMLVLVAASCVQLVAGWAAYGWVGLIAPCLAVALVHLAAEAWAELRDEARTAGVDVEVEPWGGPDAVTAPAAPAPSRPSPSTPTPSTPRKPTLRAVPARDVTHVEGWEPWMVAVAREPGQEVTRWLRARARVLGVSQSRKPNATLRHDVEVAELARVGEAVSA